MSESEYTDAIPSLQKFNLAMPAAAAAPLSRRQLLASARNAGLLAVSAGGLGSLIAACGSTAATSSASGGAGGAGGAAVRGGTLSAALTGNPSGMDPAVENVYTGDEVYDNIFSKLIGMAPNGSFIPALATKWTEQTPTEWVFDLVDNAVFHNGEKFGAKDVKYTFDRILDKSTGSPYVPNYSVIDGIEIVSPTRVIFHLKTPFGPFLTNLCQNAQIVNQKAIESSDPKLHPVGTGPFQFVSWVPNEKIVVKRAANYFQAGRPYLNGITFEFLPNEESRVQALEAGQLDWADSVPLQALPTMKSSAAVRMVSSSAAGIPDILSFNTSKPPFNNVALRQAIAWAIDRNEIVQLAYFGTGAERGSQEVGPKSPWYGGDDPYASAPNLAMAKQKLREAGYPNGLTVEYLGLPQYPNLLTTGEVIQSQLKKIGITMKITQLESITWLDRYVKGDYQLTTAYWSGTVDPDNFYANLLLTGAGNNFSKYSNPQLDALIQQARTQTAPAQRKATYESIRALVWEQVPVIFTAYETTTYVMSSHVSGSTITPTLELGFGQVWKTGQ
ncbi:MAG: ABC transporter substrate-binding protein [Streptosporangiaceae bacterium]